MLKTIFHVQMAQHQDARSAMVATILQAGTIYAQRTKARKSYAVLKDLGFVNPRAVMVAIRIQAASGSVADTQDLLNNEVITGEIGEGAKALLEDILLKNFFIVVSSGGVTGVPTPECMEAHLPRGRRATKAEIDAAWEACSK